MRDNVITFDPAVEKLWHKDYDIARLHVEVDQLLKEPSLPNLSALRHTMSSPRMGGKKRKENGGVQT